MNKALQLARRYARAFYHATPSLSETIIDHIAAFSQFLKEHKEALTYTTLGSIPTTTKVKVFETAAAEHQCAAEIISLLQLLGEHKRLSLLPLVLDAYVALYNKTHRILKVTVTTVSPLTAEQQNNLSEQLLRLTKAATVQMQLTIDTTLLAGIRVEGETFRWEHSVRKQLDTLKRN